MLKNRFISIVVLFFVALTAVAFWYSPVLFKGYAPDTVNDQLILARNLSSSGIYGTYNDYGVLLSSEMMSEQGEVSSIGNKLTARSYSWLSKFFGFPDWNGYVLTSAFLHGLALFIFAVTVFYLFCFKIALLFSFFYALLPFMWRVVYAIGNYEFGLLFLSLFLMFFLLGRNKKYRIISLFISGIFLVLSALAKEAFLILIPVLFLYLFFKDKKSLLPVFSAVLIMLSIFYLPGFFKGDNIYKNALFSSKPEKEFDYSLAGHLFPDYYTFRFDSEDFLKEYRLLEGGSQGFLKSVTIKKSASNIGEKNIGLFDRSIVATYLFVGHSARFISLEETGGPLIFALLLLGLLYLRKKDDFLYRFFVWWLVGNILLFSIILMGRNHLMDFGFAIALLSALGILYLSKIFKDYFKLNKKKELVVLFLLLVIVGYGLLLVNHVVWGRSYDGSMLKVRAYADAISMKNIQSSDVVATGLRPDANLTLNFLTDRSLIIFRPKTLEKLLVEDKLAEVFSEFNISYILGYSDDLSERIIIATEVQNVSSDSIEYKEIEVSPAKSLFMNLVK